MADDCPFADTAVYGDSARTPNLDRLAASDNACAANLIDLNTRDPAEEHCDSASDPCEERSLPAIAAALRQYVTRFAT